MHTSRTHRTARESGCLGVDQNRPPVLPPTFRRGESALHAAGYARYIGRIGALAVALGVGVAIAVSQGAAVARADDGSETPSAGTSSDSTGRTGSVGSAPSDAGATVSGRGTGAPGPSPGASGADEPGGAALSSGAGTRPRRSSVLETSERGSGAAHTLGLAVSTSSVDASPVTRYDADEIQAESRAEAVNAGTERVGSDRARSAPVAEPVSKKRVPLRSVGEPFAQQVSMRYHATDVTDSVVHIDASTPVTPDVARTPVADKIETPEPEFAQPSVVATMLAAGAPLGLPGPGEPATEARLWTIAASTRRQSELSLATDETLVPDVGLSDATPRRDAALTAEDDVIITTAGTPITFDPTFNDVDAEQQPLSIVGFTQPASGKVALNSNGTFTYTPKTGFVANDSFTYEVTNGTLIAEATVYVTVEAGDQPPVAKDDVVTVEYGQQVIIDVLGNDYDPEGGELYVSGYGTPRYGDTGGYPKGRIEYTPDQDALDAADGVFTDTFTYTVTDAAGNDATATVTVRILPPNRAPVAKDDEVETKLGTQVTIDVLANDHDPDGDKLKIENWGTPDYGTVTVKDGVFIYTPKKGFVGTDFFHYTVVDADGRLSTAAVTITVKDPDGGPDGQPDKGYTVGRDRTLTVTVGDGVKAGTDYRDWKMGLERKPAHGTLTLNDDGSFTYTPDKGFVGDDTFVYYFTNGRYADGPFTATIAVTEVDEPEPEPTQPPVKAPPVAAPPVTEPSIAVVGMDGSTPDSEPLGPAADPETPVLTDGLGACWDQWPWQRSSGPNNVVCLDAEARPQDM